MIQGVLGKSLSHLIPETPRMLGKDIATSLVSIVAWGDPPGCSRPSLTQYVPAYLTLLTSLEELAATVGPNP